MKLHSNSILGEVWQQDAKHQRMSDLHLGIVRMFSKSSQVCRRQTRTTYKAYVRNIVSNSIGMPPSLLGHKAYFTEGCDLQNPVSRSKQIFLWAGAAQSSFKSSGTVSGVKYCCCSSLRLTKATSPAYLPSHGLTMLQPG